MADTSALAAKFRQYAERVAFDASDHMDDGIGAATPISDGRPGGGEHLITTRLTVHRPLGVTITYPGNLAGMLNTGTSPHVIEGRPLLRFVWPAAPPAVIVKGTTAVVVLRHVNHPGSHKHDGWWDRATSPERWSAALELAASRVQF